MCQLNDAVKEVVIDRLEPVVCYRWFEIEKNWSDAANAHVPHNSVIRPLNGAFGNPWLVSEAKADSVPRMRTVDQFTGEVVNSGNKNGLYAYKTKEHALADGNANDYVLAKIKIWGKCVEHVDGYRAEFAQILALYPTSDKCKVTVTKKKAKAKRVFRVKAKINKDRTVTLRQEKIVNVTRKCVKRIPFEKTFRKDCPNLISVSVIPCTGLQLTI